MTQEMFTDEELSLLATITVRDAERFWADNKMATGSEALKVSEECHKLRKLCLKVQSFCIERGRA
tara:strand:+ start:19 stop:213 length:195 start_codon:yes stop_codon:yes gene_type:complete